MTPPVICTAVVEATVPQHRGQQAPRVGELRFLGTVWLQDGGLAGDWARTCSHVGEARGRPTPASAPRPTSGAHTHRATSDARGPGQDSAGAVRERSAERKLARKWPWCSSTSVSPSERGVAVALTLAALRLSTLPIRVSVNGRGRGFWFGLLPRAQPAHPRRLWVPCGSISAGPPAPRSPDPGPGLGVGRLGGHCQTDVRRGCARQATVRPTPALPADSRVAVGRTSGSHTVVSLTICLVTSDPECLPPGYLRRSVCSNPLPIFVLWGLRFSLLTRMGPYLLETSPV